MMLSERLKKIVEDSRLSLPKFSGLMGVSKSTLINYRDGIRIPSADFLEKICTEFNVNPTWLLMGEGEPYKTESQAGEAGPQPEKGQVREHGEELLKIAPAIDAEALRKIIAGVEEGLARKCRVLNPDKKAELIALLYDHFAGRKSEVEDETVERFLRLVI
jgi:transcriptional regulator with XRE-family HTH domain